MNKVLSHGPEMPRAPINEIKTTADFRPIDTDQLALTSVMHAVNGYGVAKPPASSPEVDSSADLVGAAYAVSPDLARDINERAEDIARKRRRAASSPLLKRRLI